MKKYPLLRVSTKVLMTLMVSLIMMVQVGCRKTVEDSTELPTKFTELKINPSFQFDNFINLDIAIEVSNPGTTMMSVIQVYQGDPNSDGKVIATGGTDVNNQFKTSTRVPSRMKELWVGKISPSGLNEYVAVPVTGNKLNYTFGKSGAKSTASNDCNTGTPITANGSYTINSGQVYVVQPGVILSNIALTINQGGTLRVCGTANITTLSGTGLLIVSPSGYITVPVANTYTDIDNYGTANFAQSGSNKTFNIKQDALVHNWGTLTFSNAINVKGQLINEYHTTVVEDAQTEDNGRILNYCQLFVNSNSSSALKIAT